MKFTRGQLVIWAPRIVGLGLAVFLSLFALEAFSERQGIMSAAIAFAMGLLPALIVLVTVAIGWKHEAAAATIFAGLTIFYAALELDHPSWVIIIAGPLALVGALFFVSWRFQSRDAVPS